MSILRLLIPVSLNKTGIKISIDDFGVGYSSLNYIRRLPVDVLKIDKSFVDNIHTREEDVTLVSAVIAMAHAMNQTVVAEGVEDREQLRVLKQLGCDYVQGYYFSKPVTQDKISFLLEKSRAIALSQSNKCA